MKSSKMQYKNLVKIFLLKQLKMAANQTECFRLQKRFAIKFLECEKCKPYEIYRRICDEYGDASFSQNNVCKCLKV